MEPAGLAFGVLTTMKLFIKAWELADNIKDQPLDYKHTVTSLNNQRLQLLQWSKRVGLYKDRRHGVASLLKNDAAKLRQVQDSLELLTQMFTRTDRLVQKYGFKLSETEGNTTTLLETFAKTRAVAEGHSVKEKRKSTKEVHIWRSVKWSIRDQKRCQKFVGQITSIIGDLESLTKDIAVTRAQRAIIKLRSWSKACSVSLSIFGRPKNIRKMKRHATM